jgi:hypothetical protein
MKHGEFLFFSGCGLFLFGALLRYGIGRRRFNRRTLTGFQRFRSYDEALITRGGEGCVSTIGYLIMLAGTLLTFAGLA